MAWGEERRAVPRLRLTSFCNEPGWVTTRLQEVVEFSSGGTPSKDEPVFWNGNIPWISAASMYDTRIWDSALKVTAQAIGNGTRLAPKGTILVLVRGSMLFNRVPIGIAARDVAFNQDVKALAVDRRVSAEFLLNHLVALSPRIPINETGIGAGKIETDVLADLTIYLPSRAEQDRIADCLSSLDDVIAAQAQKVEALKAHKRGLMQQLFPREGETVPQLRFPEFREADEWEARRLGEFIATLDAGVSVNSGDRPARDTEVGVLKTSAVSAGVFVASENKVVFEAQERERLREPVRGNTIIISRMNTPALVGANAYVERDQDYVFLPDRLWAAKGTGRGDMRFLSYVLGSTAGRSMLSQLATGTSGSMKNIAKMAVLEAMITAPDISEQRRVADCLSSIDSQIAAEANRLDALRGHKVGLMQRLFPSPDAD